MDEEQARKATPRLRFPEFRETGEWTTMRLGQFAELLTERVGTSTCTPYTITSGVGLVSQQAKLGRTIAGKSIRNYVIIRNNNFAFNKSATKAYPEGYIARYTGADRAAVPNSIFTCFRVDDQLVDPAYLDYLFASNLHGRWLRKFIAVGARAHGSLNVTDDDLLAVPVPLPSGAASMREQAKIAACLTSLDGVIATQGSRLDALRAYQRGLMQHLFPREGEAVPRLRFPEFEHRSEWNVTTVEGLYEFKQTTAYSRAQLNYESGSIRCIHYGDIHTRFATQFRVGAELVPFVNADEATGQIKSDAYCRVGDLVFADASEDLTGVGKTIEVVHLGGERVIAGTHTLLARRRTEDLVVGFGGYLFKSRAVRAQIEREAQGTKVMGISPTRLARVRVCIPQDKQEQKRVADCLAFLDREIAAQREALSLLTTHKAGLARQLFPASAMS